MTHTPGKWEVCEPGDYSDFDGQSRVVTGDDRRIAVVHYGGDLENRIECDANARLIAAAPCLLEACIAAEDFCASMSGDPAYSIYRQLHVAIARARGESA